MQISDDEVRRCLVVLLAQARDEASPPVDRSRAPDPSELASVHAHLKRVPATREERVSKAKRAIKKSGYEVPSHDVAAKMLGRAISDRIR